MPSNGSTKKLGLWLSVAVVLTSAVAGYAIMRHQVGNHEVRIERVETDQVDVGKRLERIKTTQEAHTGYLEDIRDDLREMRRGG